MYLPADAMFTRKLVQRIHVKALHGGVSLTMASIREQYWIPTLRLLVKSVRSACWGCKRFIASPLTVLPPGPLRTDRTNGGAAFEVVAQILLVLSSTNNARRATRKLTWLSSRVACPEPYTWNYCLV